MQTTSSTVCKPYQARTVTSSENNTKYTTLAQVVIVTARAGKGHRDSLSHLQRGQNIRHAGDSPRKLAKLLIQTLCQ